MGIFSKKENYDIHCRDRTLMNLIDSCYQETDSGSYYEDRIIFYVKEGIKYRELLKKILDEGYARHTSDNSCIIPNFQTFLSLENEMLENPIKYIGASVCVEGYVAWYIRSFPEWDFDSSGVCLYPLPCKSKVEKDICYALMDNLHATESITLRCDQPLPTEEGVHLRVHGIPHFYTAWDGSKGGEVQIFVKEWEILK